MQFTLFTRPTLKLQSSAVLAAVLGILPLKASADASFVQAYSANERGDLNLLSSLEPTLSKSLFAMYPRYWILNRNLSNLPPAPVQNYTRDYWQTVMGEKLAADYAEVQAGKSNYQYVRDIAPYVTNADASEACALALGANRGGDPMEAFALKEKVWLHVGKQPDLCDKLGRELASNPMITKTDLENRLRTLLVANHPQDASAVASMLGMGSVINVGSLAAVRSNVNSTVSAPNLNSEANQLLFLYALSLKANQQSPSGAYLDLAQNQSRLGPQVKAQAYRALALAAMDDVVAHGFHDQTVAWFDQSLANSFSPEEAYQYARISARFGEWGSLLKAIDLLPKEQASSDQWTYWRARALQATGNSGATALYQKLAQGYDYYALLSKDRLGQKVTALPADYTPTTKDALRLSQDQYFARAFVLYEADVPEVFAKREWNWAVRRARMQGDDALIVAAAKRADELSWHDRAIYALENTNSLSNHRYSYPTPFESKVVSSSRRFGLDPAWAYGIMRQESRFVTVARSHVGAGGLMQIMPSTGKYIAGKLGESYSSSRLTQIDTNIRWGTFYLTHILGQLDNQPVLATAGYNAGPSRARRWQPSSGLLPADQYVEGIPFDETRDYVKNVMTNSVHYALQFGQGPQSITQRMGSISARAN